MRRLAADIGVQPASLYRHWATKQDLLADVLVGFMDDLLDGVDAALPSLSRCRLDPVGALKSFVSFHIEAVIAHPEEVFLSHMELRALSPAHFAEVEARRAAYEDRLEAILTIGDEQGRFRVSHVRVETMAILSMLVGVANWYRRDGPMAPEDVEEIYVDLVLRSVGARG